MNLPSLDAVQQSKMRRVLNVCIAVAGLFACGTLIVNMVDAFGPPFRRPAIACDDSRPDLTAS